MRRLLFLTGLVISLLVLASLPAYALAAGTAVIHYVNDDAAGANTGTSWRDAFTDLQGALSAAVAGDQIWVAAGTYKPSSGDRTASFKLKSGVALYGGFAGLEKSLAKRSLDAASTILSGDVGTAGADADNSYHVVSAHGVTGALLDGFTVTAGRSASWGYATTMQGAGMYTNDSALTVANCAFVGNRAGVDGSDASDGGGMYNENSAPTVVNCTFSGNYAGGGGGGIYNRGGKPSTDGSPSYPVVRDCVFTENVAAGNTDKDGGGGIFNIGCETIVDRCIFTRNEARFGGGGMSNLAGQVTVTNSIFNGNSALHYGGAICNTLGMPKILNNTFHRNGWRTTPTSTYPHTWMGSAIYDFRTGSTIIDCIFSENASFGFDRGAYACREESRGAARLENCLFYGNIWRNGSTEGPSTIWYFDCAHPPQETNDLYDLDPRFVNAQGGDFHLAQDSPCIDAGVTQKYAAWWFWPFPATDVEGDKRTIDGNGDGVSEADIGADEYVPRLPDLRALLVELADDGDIDATLAARLLTYVDAAQAALDRGRRAAAIGGLKDLIVDVKASLGDTPTEAIIESKARAIIQVL